MLISSLEDGSGGKRGWLRCSCAVDGVLETSHSLDGSGYRRGYHVPWGGSLDSCCPRASEERDDDEGVQWTSLRRGDSPHTSPP